MTLRFLSAAALCLAAATQPTPAFAKPIAAQPTFDRAPMHVMMPNCSRYTAEGINEIEGVTPNLSVDWATVAPAEIPGLIDRAFAAAR